jgi:hypothetical protein
MGAAQLAHTAKDRAIHEAWNSARRAQQAAKEAADSVMQSVEEVREISGITSCERGC